MTILTIVRAGEKVAQLDVGDADPATLQELAAAFERVAADPQGWAVVTRGLSVTAASHLVEKLSESLQHVYPALRDHYRQSEVRAVPAENAIVVRFPDGGSARVTETTQGRMRVRCSRIVPGAKKKSELAEQTRTCQTSRDVLYAIDRAFDLDVPRVALKLNITGPTSEMGVYAGRIAHDLMRALGEPGLQMSSHQLGQAFGHFIHTSKWSHADADTFRDAFRIAEQRYGLQIDTADLEAALRYVGKR